MKKIKYLIVILLTQIVIAQPVREFSEKLRFLNIPTFNGSTGLNNPLRFSLLDKYGNVVSLPYIQPQSVDGFIPYIGATEDVDLGLNQLTTSQVNIINNGLTTVITLGNSIINNEGGIYTNDGGYIPIATFDPDAGSYNFGNGGILLSQNSGTIIGVHIQSADEFLYNGNNVLTDITGVLVGVENGTTTVLTSSTLDSTYISASTGFKVYCTSIIAGKMVYEKTPSGWIGYACIIP